jgi:catechol 2,3-dioxygenase-like lactoylglutathione lyase family enzyme
MVTLVVDDYDPAIAYYCDVLGFTLLEDTVLSDVKRWVVVSPGPGGGSLLLAKATNEAQRAAIGNQTGGRVGFFLHTTDFDAYYRALTEAAVDFTEAVRHEAYGRVVVFRDRYGNLWDLIERAES